MKKRVLPLFSAVLLLALLVLPLGAAAAPENDENITINVYNWGQYISDGTDGYIDVNRAFTEATGIQVNYTTYDTNESMYTKLKTGGATYDVIIPSDYMIARLIDEDMLRPLNFDNIPNYKYIDNAFLNTDYDPDNIYSVPYTWGTVGIIYNTAYVDEADTGSWDLLWNSKYSGKILMFDNCRDAFGIAELSLGYSLNTNDPDELRDAAELLKAQQPLVQSYVMDQIFETMEREEAWIAPYYAGDFLLMYKENDKLGFYFPEEGFNIFIDAMCIPKTSQHPEAAEAYINFLCDPKISAENLEYLGYATPMTEAKQYMDPEMTTSEVVYPTEETLARGESFLVLDREATQLMDELWLDVKTDGGSISTGTIIAIVVIILAIAMVFVTRKVRRKR
ncbi:MAG: spermidine/putrescine ABC transporter substrate-binding protein [Oscillospiraceae bacterium]|nr:spermidine/putrescine ABC transporter substrate-binding protein [Oscillospiraceae bacterium]